MRGASKACCLYTFILALPAGVRRKLLSSPCETWRRWTTGAGAAPVFLTLRLGVVRRCWFLAAWAVPEAVVEAAISTQVTASERVRTRTRCGQALHVPRRSCDPGCASARERVPPPADAAADGSRASHPGTPRIFCYHGETCPA